MGKDGAASRSVLIWLQGVPALHVARLPSPPLTATKQLTCQDAFRHKSLCAVQ